MYFMRATRIERCTHKIIFFVNVTYFRCADGQDNAIWNNAIWTINAWTKDILPYLYIPTFSTRFKLVK